MIYMIGLLKVQCIYSMQSQMRVSHMKILLLLIIVLLLMEHRMSILNPFQSHLEDIKMQLFFVC